MISVKTAKYLEDYKLAITFSNGRKKVVNLENEIWGEAFEPLRNPAYFKRVKVADRYTISWPNGADFAPEFLYKIGKPTNV